MSKRSKRTVAKPSETLSWTVSKLAGKGVRLGAVSWPASDPEGARQHAINTMGIRPEHAFKISVRPGH